MDKKRIGKDKVFILKSYFTMDNLIKKAICYFAFLKVPF